MLSAVATTAAQIDKWRTEEVFADLFKDVVERVEEFQLRPLELPRRRQPPRRFTGQATPHHPVGVEEHFRVHLIDLVATNLKARYDENQTGLSQYRLLENMVKNGTTNDKVDDYPELNKSALAIQL